MLARSGWVGKNPPGPIWGRFRQIFPWAGKMLKKKYMFFAYFPWWSNRPYSPDLGRQPLIWGSLLRLTSSWPPARCWWVASRSSCSISGGSAGSAQVSKNRVLINKKRYLRVRLIWNVKKTFVFLHFFRRLFHLSCKNRYLRLRRTRNDRKT